MVKNEQLSTLPKTTVLIIAVFSCSFMAAAQRKIPKILENFRGSPQLPLKNVA